MAVQSGLCWTCLETLKTGLFVKLENSADLAQMYFANILHIQVKPQSKIQMPSRMTSLYEKPLETEFLIANCRQFAIIVDNLQSKHCS